MGSCKALLLVALAALTSGAPVGARPLASQSGVVHAVLFYSPTCPHCHKVIGEDLPRIFARFGGQALILRGTAAHVVGNGTVELLLVDVSYPDGIAAYRAANEAFAIPADSMGVPRLVCGHRVLVGDRDIPTIFPRLISEGLARGGVDWPKIEGLQGLFPQAYKPGLLARRQAPDTAGRAPAGAADTGERAPADTVAAPERQPAGASDTAIRRAADTAERAPVGASDTVARPPVVTPDTAGGAARKPVGVVDTATGMPPDTAGSSGPEPVDTAVATALMETAGQGPVIARTVRVDPVGTSLALVLIVLMAFSVPWVLLRRPGATGAFPVGTVPTLVVVGVGIAAYLAYVEMTGAHAVCGPVGDCNAVQESRYANIVGIPVALVGLGGYATILAAWAWARRAQGNSAALARRIVLTLTVIGVLGSLVLTILEPFVIGAVCAWCLASAAIMTALLWTAPAPHGT